MQTGRRFRRLIGVFAALFAFSFSGCFVFPSGGTTDPSKTLRIVAGSEQRAILKQVVEPWCDKQGYSCPYELLGSVDQARLLQGGSTDYDAYWFASSVFAQLGNRDNKLSDLEPMFITPIVFAGRESVMKKLGFVGRTDVGIDDILAAISKDNTKVWSTNPTQSNSGATTLFAFLNHFAGNGPGQPLTREQLDSSAVDKGVTTFVQTMDRTPPSTGTMMRECVESAECETMFTYEALVIEQNQQLATGQESFYAVYPQGSLAISDAPLGFLDTGDNSESKREIFAELQKFLLTDSSATDEIRRLGRRPADSVGLTLDNPDTAVFNPKWGIQTDIREQGITFPSAEVIDEVLARYHTRYRKPVNTFYCLDGSGSMSGAGWEGVQDAMHQIFDPEQSRLNMLQTGPKDKTSIQIFDSGRKAGPFVVEGNDAAELKDLERQVSAVTPRGGTNMYRCVSDAVSDLAGDNRKKLIVLMSDGQSAGSDNGLAARARRIGAPIVAIAFGDADPDQLRPLAEGSGGAFVESDDLVKALREAAGYK